MVHLLLNHFYIVKQLFVISILYIVCVSCILLHKHDVYNHDYFPRLGQMFHCYSKCKEIGAIAQVHAENGTLIAEVKYCSYTCKYL